MIEVEKLEASREKILSTIRSRGPSLPVQIAKEIGFSPLFASAFLSELKGQGKINISNLRVGSSPLYFIPGQEEQLEKFTAYLNQREKEAFQKLRQEKVLSDSEQEPVLRVALRAIKDFAFPVKLMVDGESKLFWRYFTLSDDDVTDFVKSKDKKEEPKIDDKVSEESVSEQDVEEDSEDEKEEPKVVETVVPEDERPLAEKKKAKVKDSEFAINVKDVLTAKDIEILHIVAEKKREFEAKIRVDSFFGKQTYYLVAKDKKSVSEKDLISAEKKGRNERLPAIVMSPGELNKKGRQHIEHWNNLVKFERLSF